MARRPHDKTGLRSAAGLVGASGATGGRLAGGPLTKRVQVVREARAHLHAHRDAIAVDLIDRQTTKLQTDPELSFLKALALERLHRPREAAVLAERSFKQHPHPDAAMVLARCHRAIGETDAALRWCDRVEEVTPGNESIRYIRAGVLEEAGRFDEATALLEPIVTRHMAADQDLPSLARVEWSKLLVHSKRYEDAIELIDETVAMPELIDGARSQQLYLRAKACDRSKRYEDAWQSATEANTVGQLDFDPALYEQQVTQLIENWSADRMADFPMSACDSELPVFVAGMPRSGTSLIDQIIDAHPKAAGVGELDTIESFARELSAAYDPAIAPPGCFGRYDTSKWTRTANDYVRKLRRLAPPGAERVVNKALGNNKLVGLIARLFPRTRIIHALRDPRDVAVSCFMGGFNNRLHPWTTQVEWAAEAWRQSKRMMDHWRETLGVPVLEVRYEELVRDPGTQFPRIIEFLGLEWDEACTRFYESRRTVRTLSYDQVNRPIYTSSAGRNAHYARWLDSVAFPEYA